MAATRSSSELDDCIIFVRIESSMPNENPAQVVLFFNSILLQRYDRGYFHKLFSGPRETTTSLAHDPILRTEEWVEAARTEQLDNTTRPA